MFFGLLILRRQGGGTIGLTYLLWKQVWTILTGRSFLNSLIFFLHKGVIWLALAAATELLPLVSLVSLRVLPFSLYLPFLLQVFIILNMNRKFFLHAPTHDN